MYEPLLPELWAHRGAARTWRQASREYRSVFSQNTSHQREGFLRSFTSEERLIEPRLGGNYGEIYDIFHICGDVKYFQWDFKRDLGEINKNR